MLGAWDGHVHTAIFKTDNQQGPIVQHRDLYSVLCDSLDGRGVWGRMDTCIYMAESLCCPPETITTLLISYEKWKWKSLSHVPFFAIPWTIRSMEFPRPEYWRAYRSLLQGIFLAQELNQGLLHCRWILYQLSYQGNPTIQIWAKSNLLWLYSGGDQ